jgi:hypothetical protein
VEGLWKNRLGVLGTAKGIVALSITGVGFLDSGESVKNLYPLFRTGGYRSYCPPDLFW